MRVEDIKAEDVKSVYYGRPGCCCGCRGTHSEDRKQISRVLKLIQRQPEAIMDATGQSYAVYETATKTYVVYLVSEMLRG